MLHILLRILEVVGTVLEWTLIITLAFTLVVTTVGELLGHVPVRRFLFWVRGRSGQTGQPTRRFPLP